MSAKKSNLDPKLSTKKSNLDPKLSTKKSNLDPKLSTKKSNSPIEVPKLSYQEIKETTERFFAAAFCASMAEIVSEVPEDFNRISVLKISTSDKRGTFYVGIYKSIEVQE